MQYLLIRALITIIIEEQVNIFSFTREICCHLSLGRMELLSSPNSPGRTKGANAVCRQSDCYVSCVQHPNNKL